MKLKINKACDLNSISVLPPHSRRSSIMQQPRSQHSQQSFSQGISSQPNGSFSQFSQTSFDEVLTDNQRFSSQEKDNSVKRLSCLAPVSYPREEGQMPISRSSSSLTRKWSSAAAPEHKCQLSDEVEHKFSVMETSLNRLGMILDSVQADVMQVNKGTKELSLEVEGIRQKSISHHDSIHQLIRSQEDTKTFLESISNQQRTVMQQDKTEEILSAVLDLRKQIDTEFQNKNEKRYQCLSQELQAVKCSLKNLQQKNLPFPMLPPKATGESSSQRSFLRREPVPLKVLKEANPVPKVEIGSWTTVKAEKAATYQYGNSCKNPKQRKDYSDKEQKVFIEIDDETDDDFACLLVEKDSDNHSMDELDEVTAQILRKARRRKRKQDCKRSIAGSRR